jgi:EmrB/QacA subfamily drug resistance transporter
MMLPHARTRPGLVLAAIAAAVAIVTLDTTILNVAIPTIRRDLHTGLASLQWVITGYSLTLGSLLIIGGRIGDLFGVRRSFITGALLFATGSLLASLATSTPQLVAGEALIEGVGACLLFPASLATLSTVFRDAARAKAFAVWGGVAGASAALGPVLGGWLTSDYSWRWGFRINVVVAPLAALAALAALPPDARREHRPRLDIGGAALLAVGLFFVVFAVTEGPDHGWWANRGQGLALGSVTLWSSTWPISPVVAAVTIAVAALLAFVGFERAMARGHRDPLIDPRLFTNRGVSGGLITAATVVMAQAGLMFVLAVFLQATHHLQPVTAGRWLLPVGLAVLAGAQAGGVGAEKAGATTVVRAGILIQLAGVLFAAAILHTSIGWAALAVALVVFGFGAGMASSQLQNVILSEVPRERAGSASGVATTNNSLGAALGVAVLGSVLRIGTLGNAHSARWALLAAAGLLATGAVASFAIPVRKPQPEPHGTPTAPGPSRRQASARTRRPRHQVKRRQTDHVRRSGETMR